MLSYLPDQILAPPTPHKGGPRVEHQQNYTLRATKNVIMHPGLRLTINHTGTEEFYQGEEEVSFSLVCENRTELPKGITIILYLYLPNE